MTIIMFNKSKPYVFVKGAFNGKTKTYGSCGVLLENDNLHIIQDYGRHPNEIIMVDIAGEIHATMSAVELAIKLGLDSIQIIHSHPGIKDWTTYSCKTNHPLIENYNARIRSAMRYIKIKFVDMKNVSNNEGNKIAEKLARQAVDLK